MRGSRLAALTSSSPQVARNSRRLPLTRRKPTIQKRANRMSQPDAIQTPATIASMINKRLMKQLVIKSRLKTMKKLRAAMRMRKRKRRRRSSP